MTLGRSAPRWILWIITLRSMELPVCASNEYDSWHIAQYCRSVRPPPWNARLSWQALQVSLSTISRPDALIGSFVTGLNVYTGLFAGIAGLSRISKPTRCGIEPSNGISASPCRLFANLYV